MLYYTVFHIDSKIAGTSFNMLIHRDIVKAVNI